SIAPAEFMAAAGVESRPTKVDRPSDMVGLVDTGSNNDSPLNTDETIAAMETMYRLSNQKLEVVDTGLANEAEVKRLVRCGYLKSTYLADTFADRPVDPSADPTIVGPEGIFSAAEFNGDGEFRKTASVMKMVISPDPGAGAGTITMGGYDHHTGDRSTGETRDLGVGR